jgi:WD40 repeat protein
MLGRIARLATVAALIAFVGCSSEHREGQSPSGGPSTPVVDIGAPLYVVGVIPPAPKVSVAVNPIVVPDCRVTVFDTEEVPSQKDGQVLFVGTELTTGREPLLLLPSGLGPMLISAEVAANEQLDRIREEPVKRIVTVRIAGQDLKYRQLREGDRVLPYQLLARLDDRIARDEYLSKEAKIGAAIADLRTSEKTRDEAEQRYLTTRKLRSININRMPAVADEEVRGAFLTWEKYKYEVDSKKAAITVSERELNQTKTALEYHEIRAANIHGIIKAIYKKRGEAVKSQPSYEPVIQIHCLDHLRIEGLVDEQYRQRLYKGMPVVIEPAVSQSRDPLLFHGHTQEVNSVAVGKSAKDLIIVTGSEDRTAVVWEGATGLRRKILRHPAAVKTVACTPPGAKENFFLTGDAEGTVRLWDPDSKSDEPVRTFNGEHRGAVNCLAFTPDGKFCASGGEDREIILWDPATGNELYRFPAEFNHRGGITSLQFTPRCQLVSAGQDNTIRLWDVGQAGARLKTTIEGRSGDITKLGASPDGSLTLFDKGKELHIMSLPAGSTEAALRNSSGATNFTTFALFSPDAHLILTAGPSGYAQLWRTPTPSTRGYELRQLMSPGSMPTCGAFGKRVGADGSEQTFVVTGHRGGEVQIYPVPSQAEIEKQLVVPVTLIDQSVETSSRQLRIWADVPNAARYHLINGGTATMAIYPGK